MDIEKGDIEASGNVSAEENPQSKGDATASAAELGSNVEDYLLPRSITQRLAKGVLPPNTAIHRDAMLAITKAATVFVSYLSSHANEETNKKTITPQDVLAALSGIEFENFRPRLERELAIYTEAAARKRRGKKEGKDVSNTGGNEGVNDEPENKRLKRDIGEVEKSEDQEAGGSSIVTNGDSKMRDQNDAKQSTVGGQNGDDKGGDSTDTMEDTNLDDEEESNDDGDKHGEEEEEEDEDEEEEEEEEEDKASPHEIEIESDASRKRNRKQGRSGLDSNSGSDSDEF